MASEETDELKQEILTTIEQLVQTLWDTLRDTLGSKTTRALLNRGVDKCVSEYPWLTRVRPTADGPDLAGLRADSQSLPDITNLQMGIVSYVGAVTKILVLLTGNIVTQDVERKMTPMIARVKEEPTR